MPKSGNLHGATNPSGTTFRVWAPFASSVTVAGSFNFWNPQAAHLTDEGGGFSSVDVPDARVDDQYKFVLGNPAIQNPLWKNDPYARSMTNSAGNSVIAEPDYICKALH